MLKAILIVDDNADNLMLLEKLFKSKGFEVVLAHNGMEALESAHMAPPDLIISDILMPVMDGFMLCRKWNQDPLLKQIPFIFYTATYTDSRDEHLAMSLGATRFIIKPAEPQTFLETIQGVLDEFKRGVIPAVSSSSQNEEVILSKYNETLVHKLEQKVQEMKEANLALEHEISQRKLAEDSLSQSEEKLKRVFASIAGGIIIVDLEGIILDGNDNSFNMIGCNSKETLLGKNVFDFFAPEEKDRASSIFRQTIASGASYYHQYTALRLNGTNFPVEASSCLATDKSGAPLFVVISFSDITERKVLENRIMEHYAREKKQREELQEEANARGMFIEVLAHELRTPLTPILASAGMLDEVLNTQPAGIQTKLCTNINTGAQTLASRLEELLDLASYSRGVFRLHPQPVDLNQLIAEVATQIQSVLAPNSQKLIIENSDGFPPIEVDPFRFKQLLLSLLSNASKFSAPDSAIQLKVKHQDDKLLIEVIDNGTGISPEEQARLFQPYHRVEQDRQKFPGIGLGLAVCKQIVEAHHGNIWVSSQIGTGSTFGVTIPLKTA
jgi:PAS domain S-box-containing protein